MTSPAPGVVVSLEAIYDKQVAMDGQVGELKGLLERTIALQEQTNSGLRDDVKEIRSDVDELQGWKAAVVIDIHLLKEAAATKERRRTPWTAIITAVATIITAGFLILNQYNQQIAFFERFAP